jgi:hypothetical protein
MNGGRLLLIFIAALTSACAGIAQLTDSPALIVDSNAASRMELQSAVSKVLGTADITLAPDALTTTSLLTIERVPTRDSQGRLLNGRELGRPEQFTLVKSGERCVLIHAGSGMRIPLDSVRCRAG